MANQTNTIFLDGKTLNLSRLRKISLGADLQIDNAAKRRVQTSENYIKEIVKSNQCVYGVNTGYGYLANTRISRSQLKALQLNLVKSHAAGWGNPFSQQETRAVMALRLHILIKGYAGVRWELCEALLELIRAEIYPIIPEYGSVGASGDLAPLAHMALPLIGEGMVMYRNKLTTARQALKSAKLLPITLMEKEGLSLVNGTQAMLSVGGLALAEALLLLDKADRIVALSFEALQGHVDALSPLIHQARGHPGQIQVAERILSELNGSYLHDKSLVRVRVQDPYSLRCSPQVHGPSREALEFAAGVVERELNAATDNPLVFSDDRKILNGGNFHGQPIAMAFDIAAIALSELASISERRLELLLNPQHSGLPAFLTPFPGTNSGYMAAQYLSASLVNQNKLLANPACTDSIPGNVGIEDHVSMGMTSARKLRQLVANVSTVLAVEMLAAAQAIDLRSTKHLGTGTTRTYKRLRAVVPRLVKDRIISEDIAGAVKVFHEL